MKIKAIALNTFKEAVRNKVYYLLIVVGILFALSSQIMSLLTLGDKVKVLKDIGLASINFFCVLIAIFTGINLVFKEIDKKTIYNIVSKPISRSNFILGKFFGLAVTLLVALLSMALIFFVFLLLSTGEFDAKVLLYFILLYFELLIISAISILFSSFSTPILSSIFTISLYLIGHLSWTFNEFKYNLTETFEKVVVYSLYYIIPNLEKLNIKNDIVLKIPIESDVFIGSIIYAVCYIAAVLILAALIFNKKEFK
ncbi:MAG: ABC transporter permease subunit [Candidatus Aminicenantes bacterium]|jgi:ABC-type transport system involved in multi-copper enzyme maturation permease subunit|nr:ABC transporter permease subunit [Candidatus Aminicenantes bacterium]